MAMSASGWCQCCSITWRAPSCWFRAAAEQGHETVEVLQLDIAAEDAADKIPPGAAVVNLTEVTPPAVAAEVVRTGGIFLDTSATSDYVRALRQAMADAGGPGTGILCVGTASGLSTLMAADAVVAEGTEIVDIGVELSMGRHYGRAATEWSINALGARYRLFGNEMSGANSPSGRRSAGGQRSGWAFPWTASQNILGMPRRISSAPSLLSTLPR